MLITTLLIKVFLSLNYFDGNFSEVIFYNTTLVLTFLNSINHLPQTQLPLFKVIYSYLAYPKI